MLLLLIKKKIRSLPCISYESSVCGSLVLICWIGKILSRQIFQWVRVHLVGIQWRVRGVVHNFPPSSLIQPNKDHLSKSPNKNHLSKPIKKAYWSKGTKQLKIKASEITATNDRGLICGTLFILSQIFVSSPKKTTIGIKTCN